MASFFSSGLDDRYNKTRSPRISDPPSFNPSYPRESSFGSSTRMSMNSPSSAMNDSRNLHRRFTTSYSTLAQQRRSAYDMPAADIFAFQPTISPADKKKQEYEQLKQKRMERQKRLDMLTQESHREEMELARLSQELGIESSGHGHQSEPTTPPEYRDAGFPTSLSRPNRFSAGNLISPTGMFKAFGKLDSQLTSPPTERARAYNALTAGAPSGPRSKNNSDEEDNQEEVLDYNHRSAASFNRNSMPVTRRDLGTNPDQASDLGHVNTHRFLFGDDDKDHQLSTTPRPKSYFQDKDNFPVLLKRDTNGNMQYSTGSSALDLSSADESEPASSQTSKRSSMQRAYPSQGVNMNGYGFSSAHLTSGDSPPFGYPQANSESLSSSTKNTATPNNRHSVGAGTSLTTTPRRPGLIASPSSTMAETSVTPKLQQSYSTNDIPTVKNVNNSAQPQYQTHIPQPTTTAEQRLHSHNYSLGRIPPQGLNSAGMNSKRHSREMSGNVESQSDESGPSTMQSIGGVLHGGPNAPQPSGSQRTPPSGSEVSSTFNGQSAMSAAPLATSFNNGAAITHSPNPLGNVNMTGPNNARPHAGLLAMISSQWNPAAYQWNTISSSPPYQGYNGYSSRPSEAQTPRSRRGTGSDDTARYSTFSLDQMLGRVFELCTDQNGCRFLQKKLEEGNSQDIHIIFDETKDHMVKLMTDPFGNYLVQKLLEHTKSEHHTEMIKNAAKDMVNIALNQHGTRALQKMIEYVAEQDQIDILVNALKDSVVPMIQDLNGNHVIQKCLNRLQPPNIQFIIDAVSQHCVVVGTHRHGCCVIQRCIDHATPDQKAQLVSAITTCSLPLVQDPFGNYVLQYIFDQGETSFSQLLCQTFLGKIADLSKQKFSSNVIEKCIRIAEMDTKHQMIEELISSPSFDQVADDAFGNYVVQTAWDHAKEADEERLAEKVRPLLARMRHKPYGRRFASRLNDRDKRFGVVPGPSASQLTSPTASYVTMNMPSTPIGAGMFGSHPDSGYGHGAFGLSGPHFNQANMASGGDFSRPTSHHMHNPSQAPFSPMSQYSTFSSQGQHTAFSPQNQHFNSFGQGFGRPSGY